ncbi:DinB family protein [Thermoleptolyngbya sp. M55_K2018_002]|uniref:DinB family protein n=1 Tax=Thermoleptolyngbya sp. M55_K2018_002 TaxID=2747808 RepID=UPI0019F82F7E|nr:DinB family protein [Thermoleptolyngbya sp. M55_K2018_002]HIK39045.1 damage-inducible protein DinB [Thermoleptolyngbya sp. M55_K2018_002]
MIDVDYCQTMAKYNQWMNRRLYALCADLSDGDRRQDRGAFFKSIHGTLNHLLYGDRAWLRRFTHQPLTGLAIGQDLYENFDELRQAREQCDKEILIWVQRITADWLAQPFTFHSKADGKAHTLPTWTLVVHLFNHQTHHRGQITTLLSQLGLDPGVTDLPWLPDLATAVGAGIVGADIGAPSVDPSL